MDLDKQLDNIQNENVDTIIAGAAVIGSALVIGNLISMFAGTLSITNSLKVNKELSDRINGILNSGNKWIVHVYPERGPNAFSLGFGRHIFVTSSLLKIMNEREVDAILLHEVYHSAKHHTPKRLMMQYPLYYIAAAVAMAATTSAIPFTAFFAFWLVNNVGNILYNITMGRRHEVKADDFAVQQGYGKDLIAAFKKLEEWISKKTKSRVCGRVCQIMNKIDQAIDEHPTFEVRIKRILEGMDKLKVKNLSFVKLKNKALEMWKRNG